MGHRPAARRSPRPAPRSRTNWVTGMTCARQPNRSLQRTAMPQRSSKNTSVACAPWTGPWRDAPLPRPRSSEAPAAPSGAPAPMLAARLWRRPGCHATSASTPWPSAWSGWTKGGLAPGPRAPADDPAARGGRDRGAGARGAWSLGLGPSRCAPPAEGRSRPGGIGAAAAARAARGQGAASGHRRAPRPRGGTRSAGQPELLARPVAWLSRPCSAPYHEGSGAVFWCLSLAGAARYWTHRGFPRRRVTRRSPPRRLCGAPPTPLHERSTRP
jgi:hypothetical protein